MITAVDSSVLLDIFKPDPDFGPLSKAALRSGLREGRLVACEVVWAEIGSLFPSPELARAAMDRLEVEFSSLLVESVLSAAAVWKVYRARGGQRQRVVADFLIGAHALTQADRLMTRDRGFYRTYFRGLKITDPTSARSKL